VPDPDDKKTKQEEEQEEVENELESVLAEAEKAEREELSEPAFSLDDSEGDDDSDSSKAADDNDGDQPPAKPDDKQDDDAPKDEGKKEEPADGKDKQGDDKPPEQPEQKQDETPEESPEDAIPDIEEGKSPKAQDYRNLRDVTTRFKKERNEAKDRVKNLEERLAAAEEQLARIAKGGSTVPDASAAGGDSTPESAKSAGDDAPKGPTPSEVFNYLVHASNRELDETKLQSGHTNESVERAARAAIVDMTPEQLIGVIDDARAGKFGKYNADVIEEARAALTEAQFRKPSSSDSAGKQQDEPKSDIIIPQEVQTKQAESTNRVIAKHAFLQNPEDPKFKDFQKHLTEFQIRAFGADLKSGPESWRITSDPNLAEWQAEQVLAEMAKTEQASTNADPDKARLEQENRNLRKQLDKGRRTADGGTPPPDEDVDSAEALEAQLDMKMREAEAAA